MATKRKRRNVHLEILQAAVNLFGLHSFHGVTTRQLARAASVFEPAIYSCFKNKKNLYLEAVNSVVSHLKHQFANLMEGLFGSTEQVTTARMREAVRIWYAAVPRPYARLLLQVLISDDELVNIAREPLDQLINALAKMLEQRKPSNRKFSAHAAATSLIRNLFWGKVIDGKTADQQIDEVLQQWLLSIETN